MQVLTNIINSQCNVWQREGMMSSSFNLGLYPYLHMSMKIGLGIPFIEDLHKALLFSLATILQ